MVAAISQTGRTPRFGVATMPITHRSAGASGTRAGLASAGTLRLRRGDLLYTAGTAADHLYVLRSGQVRIYLMTDEGKKVVIETVPAPSLLGEAVLSVSRLHETYAEAVEDAELLAVERLSVESLLRAQPELAVRLLEAVALRLLTMAQRLEDRVVKAVPARLARALLLLVPAPTYEAFPIKQSEIAEVAGTSRETATRVLNQFESDGIIALGRTRVRLLHPEALSRIAEARAS